MRRCVVVSFAAFLVCALFLQWCAGAFVAEFSGSDEAAHFVTSLMVHDYATSGMAVAPRRFAEDYYVRYPKVAFGIWPPLFHLSQAGWMLAFSPTRVSVMVLMALWTALLATGCFCAVRPRYGFFVALLLGLMLVSLPELQASTNRDMPDVMMSCFMFGAALFFGRYLDRQRTRDAFFFGVLAAIAILVKYNALALVLLPPIAVLLGRRWDLPRRPSFWLPVAVVAALCGPWYLFNRNLVRYAMEPSPGVADIPAAVRENLATLVGLLGIPLLAIALTGVFAKLRPASAKERGTWITAAALIAATWLFHSVLYPIHESRYLLAAAPALLMFVAAGCEAIAAWLSRRLRFKFVNCAAAVTLACLIFVLFTFRVSGKRHYGVAELAARLDARSKTAGQFILVSGSWETEGMMVSEMALLDRQLRDCVLRASKVLARSTWMGEHYQVLYNRPEDIAQMLKDAPISIVAIDRSPDYNRPHHQMLQAALALQPDVWVPMEQVSENEIQVFERRGPRPVIPANIYVDLSRTIGRSLAVPRSESSVQ